MFITNATDDPLHERFAHAVCDAGRFSLNWNDDQAVTDWYGMYCGI